jgi:uncharacterized protein involved in exopolysaccharide biosynthesis
MENNEQLGVSVLDLLLVLAENIKLLVVGPLAMGVIALLAGFALPQSFTSQAILMSAPAQAASMMTSPLVLDPVIKILNFADGSSIEAARAKLAGQIKAVMGKDALLRLEVTAKTPAEAQKNANLIIDAYLKSTAPGELDRADLEKRLTYAKTSLESVRKLIERITSDGTGILNKPITLGEAGTSVVALGELQAHYLGEVLSIPRTLQGLSRDAVIQPPTLPTEAVAPKKSLIAILAALASGFVLLLWVFVRKAWANTQNDPVVAVKQARVRAALGFKSVSQ